MELGDMDRVMREVGRIFFEVRQLLPEDRRKDLGERMDRVQAQYQHLRGH